ncbi:putative olfactory receptor 10D3 [Tachyglossus aculeatus]|uniref:putative olfactory receptor 10D3 n=1 Tax=Tachyglossus aculeatus TaxID=9261 RepID=UPI0018F2F70B|nr:putative olfactory receptor 10D3 [Tachyglossus aculeatus]
MWNHTSVTEFILLGIPHTEGLETVLFIVFVTFYSLTVLGNGLILTIIAASPRLRTPMYFFLGILSFFDLLFPSVTALKLLASLSGRGRAISYGGCVCQVFFYHILGCTESFLYTVMAYDRYAAICHPLRYNVIMNPGVCTGLAAGTWLGGGLQAVLLTCLTFRLPYCGPNRVDYFFCDIPAVLPLACADASMVQAISFINVGLISLACFLIVLISYARIAHSILHMRSAEGRRRAFSTCSSHLTSIFLFYGPVALIYLLPDPSPRFSAGIQILNNLVIPMLNPVIYSLRNKEVGTALKTLLSQTK